MAHVGILQHFWCEPAVVFEETLRELGHEITYVELYREAPVPDPQAFDAWLVMGGPMSVNDEEKYPYFVPEKKLLAQLIEQDRPVMGICLGAQLIADAAGSKVYPLRPKEIGLYPVHLTDAAVADPLFRLLEPVQEVFQWHGETFDLPPKALFLAYSHRFPHQAFRLGKRVYAVQFHIECDLKIALTWRDNWQKELAELPEEDKFEQFEARLPEAFEKQNALARKFITQWAKLFD